MTDPSLDCPNKPPRQKRCDCSTCIDREVREYGEPVLDWSERFKREENQKRVEQLWSEAGPRLCEHGADAWVCESCRQMEVRS